MLTEERIKNNQSRVFGSEVGAIIGVDRFKAPIDVWLSKVNGPPETTWSHHLERGTHLGPALVHWYQHRTGRTVNHYGADERTYFSDRYPLLAATPDGIVGDTRVLEIKSLSPFAAQKLDVRDGVHESFLPQLYWEMAATGMPRADLCLFDGDDIHVHEVSYNHDFFMELYLSVETWWFNHIVLGERPGVSASPRFAEYLAKAHPEDNGEKLEADEEAEEMLEELASARAALAIHEEQKELLENKLKAKMGDAKRLEGKAGKVCWSTYAPRASVNYKAIVEELNVPGELLAKHTSTRQGRTFRFTPTKAKTR